VVQTYLFKALINILSPQFSKVFFLGNCEHGPSCKICRNFTDCTDMSIHFFIFGQCFILTVQIKKRNRLLRVETTTTVG